MQNTNIRDEVHSQQPGRAYTVVSGQYGASQGTAFPSSQGYGVTRVQSSSAAPFSLFPRDEDQRPYNVASSHPSQEARGTSRSGSNDRGDPGRRATYTRHEEGEAAVYTIARPPVSSQQASTPPQPGYGTENRQSATQLSRLSYSFTQLQFRDYSSSENFIANNPSILREDPNKLVQEAIRLEKEGKHSQAKICVQQSLLLRKCSRLTDDDCRAFFSALRSNDKKVLGAFWDDFDKTIDAVRKAAQTETPASSRPPLERPRRDSNDDTLSTSMRKMSISNSKTRDHTRTFGAGVAAEDDPTQFGEARSGSGRRRLTIDPVVEEDSVVGAPSIDPDIRGTEEDREDLDPRYSKRQDAKKFFVVGRVFALLWHESAGDGKPGADPSLVEHITVGRYGQRVFSHIRRMAVVRERGGYCVCIPINTYGGQGVMKHGLATAERQAHSIIHANDTAPYATEEERPFLVKKPIAVKMASREQKLDKMSRINFGKPSSVEWNVKVMHVGRVVPESMATFLGNYANESDRGNRY